MSTVVLDASALLAMLRGEPGADRVEQALTDSLMSIVNLAEVASHYLKLGMPDDDVRAMLQPLPIRMVDADVQSAWDAARLRPLTVRAGLSLGDRFCLALAKRNQLHVLTADRQWEDIAQAVGIHVLVIR